MAEEEGETVVVQSGEHGELETNAGGKDSKGRHNKTSEVDTKAKALEIISRAASVYGWTAARGRGSIWQSRAPCRDSPGADGHGWIIV